METEISINRWNGNYYGEIFCQTAYRNSNGDPIMTWVQVTNEYLFKTSAKIALWFYKRRAKRLEQYKQN